MSERARSNTPPKEPSPSIARSTVSDRMESTRVSSMLNNITYCTVENADHLLTSLEVSIYDGRDAFISTFMKKIVSGAPASGAITTPSSPAANHAIVSGSPLRSPLHSHSVGRSSSAVADAASFTQVSESIEFIENTIEQNLVLARHSRQAKTKALEALNPSRVKKTDHQIKKERERDLAVKPIAKSRAATATATATARTGAAARTGATGTSSEDIFDKMITDKDKVSHVEFATYIGAKSEPCQVHDRTECDYATLLSDYSSEHASIVYNEMGKTGFIGTDELKRVNELHQKLNAKFKSSIKTARGNHVGQQTCRDCAANLFEIYKEHADNHSSLHVPATKVVLTMPYVIYRDIKNDDTQQDNNDITTALQGNNGPRGFDATSSWGNNLVNWYWAMGSCDAAVQAFDKDRHQIFAFQSTRCGFDDLDQKKPQIPIIRSEFTVVDRSKGRANTREPIQCIPLQFGHKTVECVFNPRLDAKIASVSGDKLPSSISVPPFLCTYMPEVTLNHLSVKDSKKRIGINRWSDLHQAFINMCETTFKPDGATFFRTATQPPESCGESIPDKIKHMGITWVLTAVSQGPVSLDATLDKIHLACDNVEGRRATGSCKEHKWVVLSDMFLAPNDKTSECAKYIGFTCGSSAKERGDAGKFWDMFWTQKILDTQCSFWSGDYLAVAATTAPGLAWGIIVNSTVTVLATEGQRPTINAHELKRIRKFVAGAHRESKPYEFFITRIKMLLEYLAFTFIRDIIRLIRNPDTLTFGNLGQPPTEPHVALDTILILCAALRSITTSVKLKTNAQGQFQPEVAIDETCYVDITDGLFNTFVPSDPIRIDASFCSEHGIYDRESYFRKIIPLASLDNALNKHSGLLWAYDYISDYAPDVRLQTKDLGQIFTLHCKSKRDKSESESESEYVKVEQNLGVTFESVDVLCIAKMIREKQTKPLKKYKDNYSGWLQRLCDSKLKVFLDQNECNGIFCEFVRFDLPDTLGGGNRLRNYLGGVLFPAPMLCQEARAQVSSDSVQLPSSPAAVSRVGPESQLGSSQQPFGDSDMDQTGSQEHDHITELVSGAGQDPDTNPRQFVTDLQEVNACSQPPVDPRPSSNSRNSTPPREGQRDRSRSTAPATHRPRHYEESTFASRAKAREPYAREPYRKGGNTKRTKRYKRKSNRRNKKNTRYSLRNTFKHRKTRRRN